MSSNAGPLTVSVAAAAEADSVTTMTGTAAPGTASVGDRAGPATCAASTITGGGVLVGVDASEAAGIEVAIATDGCEFFTLDSRVGEAADTAGLAELPAAVGRGVIVEPVARCGVASTRLGDAVGLTTCVAGRVVGVAVSVGVKVSVTEIGPKKFES